MICRICKSVKEKNDFLLRDQSLCKECYRERENIRTHSSFEKYATFVLKQVKTFCKNFEIPFEIGKIDIINQINNQDNKCPTCNKELELIFKGGNNPFCERKSICKGFKVDNIRIIHRKCQKYKVGGQDYKLSTVKEYFRNIKNNQKECFRCKKVKKLELFSKRKSKGSYRQDNHNNTCKKCLKKDPNILCNALIRRIKESNHKIPIDISKKDILNLYDQQEGICYYSDKELIWEEGHKDNIKIERIDSSLGYTLKNSILVCYSEGKQHLNVGDWSLENRKEIKKLKSKGLKKCLRCEKIYKIIRFKNICEQCEIKDKEKINYHISTQISKFKRLEIFKNQEININKDDIIKKFSIQKGVCEFTNKEIVLEGQKKDSFKITSLKFNKSKLDLEDITLVHKSYNPYKGYKSPKANKSFDERRRIERKKIIDKIRNYTKQDFSELYNKLCYSCNSVLPNDEFKNIKKNSFSGLCKKCDHSKRRKDLENIYQNSQAEYLNYLSGKKIDFIYIRKYFTKIISRLNSSASKNRNNVQGKFNITIDDVINQFIRQEGRCFYTNRELIFLNSEKNNSFIPSIDRYDSKDGYTKKNIRICCNAINIMKNDQPFNVLYSVAYKRKLNLMETSND